MTEQEKEGEYIVCWSCDEVISRIELCKNDGFCPLCNQEIEE